MVFHTGCLNGRRQAGLALIFNQAIMTFFVGFVPQYGGHIEDGRVCAGCHTLITETMDLNGDPTGGEFVEQATWHEWKNSIYPADEGTSCRGCHMPRIEDEIILASQYAFLPGHSPFGLHHLAGGNTFMLELMSEVTALRERTDTIERLLDEKGFVARADIEAYRPDAAGEAERSAWAQAFIQRVMRFHEPGAS